MHHIQPSGIFTIYTSTCYFQHVVKTSTLYCCAFHSSKGFSFENICGCFSPACGRGFYKSSSQDLQCSRCPAHSYNDREGSWRCDCEDGYYRAVSDPPSVACTSKAPRPAQLPGQLPGLGSSRPLKMARPRPTPRLNKRVNC